jgi:hypothetical protein
MRCDTTIATTGDGDPERDQFLLDWREDPWRVSGLREIGEGLVDIGDQFSKRSPLGCELVKHLSAMAVDAVFGHLSTPSLLLRGWEAIAFIPPRV